MSRPSKARRALVLVIVLIALAVGVSWLMQRSRLVSSDDASLDAEVVHIASTVGGRISRIAVRENDAVKAGEVLFQIDPEPLRLALQQTEADLALAQAGLAGQHRGVGTQRSAAALAADQTLRARTNLALAQRTADRLRPLAAKGYVPALQLDQAETAAHDAQTSLRQALEQEQAAGKAVGNVDAGEATVQARQAAVALARHALESATVKAPHDGRVVGLSVSSGEIVLPSQPLFTLVRSDEWFAVANLRESELEGVAVGGCATVYSLIDRRQSLRGTVQGIGYGVLDAGRINLPRSLPYVQKSMNWVHVAQRFPVRIRLDAPPGSLMRLGASAVVEVGHGSACR